MRHSSRARHGCEPSLRLSFRQSEVDGPDVSIRTGSDTADGDMRIDQIQLDLPIHAAQIRDELVVCKPTTGDKRGVSPRIRVLATQVATPGVRWSSLCLLTP